MRLEMAVAVTRPLARLTTRDDDRVTELGPAAVEVIVDDQAAADARAEREHDQVGHTLPRSEAPLREGCSVAVVLDTGGKRVALARPIREVHTVERKVHGPESDAGSPVDVQWDPVSDGRRTVIQQILDDSVDRAEHRRLVSVGRRDLDRAADRAVAQDESCEDLRPAEVDPDNTLFTHVAATITARMPEQEKPYRVYRGGRAKGKVPLQRPTNGRSKDSGRGAPSSAARRRRVG